jgi:hypothetical protein
MTTRIHCSLGPFRVTAHRAALAAILVCPETGSTLFGLGICN